MPLHTYSSRDFTRDVSAAKRAAEKGPVFITDRGKPIAVLSPVEPQTNAAWAWRMVADGKAGWSGGKPRGMHPPVPGRGTPTSQLIIEDRR